MTALRTITRIDQAEDLPAGLLAGEGLVRTATGWERASTLRQTTARNTRQRETLPRLGGIASATAPTAGVLYVMRIDLAAGAYTTVTLITGSTQGVTLTNTFLALYNATTLTRVAVSADLSAPLAALVVNAAGTFTLNYTALAGEYYLGLLVGSAVTMPTLLRGGAFNSAQFALEPATAQRHNTTGLTAAPDPLVLQVSPSGIVRFYARYE